MKEQEKKQIALLLMFAEGSVESTRVFARVDDARKVGAKLLLDHVLTHWEDMEESMELTTAGSNSFRLETARLKVLFEREQYDALLLEWFHWVCEGWYDHEEPVYVEVRLMDLE